MRTIYFLTIALLTLSAFTQKSKVKLYAYEQHVIPGVRKITIDEKGNSQELPPRINIHYYIYLESAPSKQMEIKHAWIHGKLYDVEVENPTLPVVVHNLTYPKKFSDTLVRKTGKKVVAIIPKESKNTFKVSSSVKKKISSHDVVIHTLENGRDCFYYLSAIKLLDPIAMQ